MKTFSLIILTISICFSSFGQVHQDSVLLVGDIPNKTITNIKFDDMLKIKSLKSTDLNLVITEFFFSTTENGKTIIIPSKSNRLTKEMYDKIKDIKKNNEFGKAVNFQKIIGTKNGKKVELPIYIMVVNK